jgi:hypothetical protein
LSRSKKKTISNEISAKYDAIPIIHVKMADLIKMGISFFKILKI